MRQLTTIITNKGEHEQLKDRITAAITYFEPLLQDISTDIFTIIAQIEGVRGVKAYNTELRTLELLFFNQLKKMKFLLTPGIPFRPILMKTQRKRLPNLTNRSHITKSTRHLN